MSTPLHEQAYKIYQEKGQDGVLAWALARGHRKWGYCIPCEWESPMDRDSCLVCGTTYEKENIGKTSEVSS